MDTWYELPDAKWAGGGRDAHPSLEVDGLDVTSSQTEPTEDGRE